MTGQTDRLNGLLGDTGMKPPVRLATTAAITLTGEQTIDGVAAVTGDAVLVKNQASSIDNGIYLVDTGAWTRRPDADGPYDLRTGTLVLVVAGTANAGKTYECTAADPISPGTSTLTFVQYTVGAAPSTPISLANGGFGASLVSVNAGLALLGVVQCTGEAGPANAQTCTVDALVTAFRQDQLFIFTPTLANTNAATITVTPQGGGALGSPALRMNGVALVGGELQAGVPVLLQHDGAFLHILGPTSPAVIGISAILKTFVAAKGDLIGASANDTPVILSVGADGKILQADASQTSGLIWKDRINLVGVVASTSGTSIDFTGIPAWAKEITIDFAGVSLSGTANYLVQIGDSGGIEATGYLGSSALLPNGAAIQAANSTTGFIAVCGVAAAVIHGRMVLTLVDPATNMWASTHILGFSTTSVTTGGGSKATSAVLDRVRVTSTTGSDTFDLGLINVSYR